MKVKKTRFGYFELAKKPNPYQLSSYYAGKVLSKPKRKLFEKIFG